MTNHYELKIDWGKTQIDYEPETKEMCVCGGGGWGDGRILSEVGLELFFSAFDVGHARSSVRWLPGSLLSLTVRVHWPVLASVGWSAKRLGRLSRNVGKLCRICCARGSTFLSRVHSGLNQQDPVSCGIS